MSKYFMIYDEMDCYYDIYIFEESVNITELKTLVTKIKKENIGTWTLEMIEKEIRKRYKVKEIALIDGVLDNMVEMNKVGVKNEK